MSESVQSPVRIIRAIFSPRHVVPNKEKDSFYRTVFALSPELRIFSNAGELTRFLSGVSASRFGVDAIFLDIDCLEKTFFWFTPFATIKKISSHTANAGVPLFLLCSRTQPKTVAVVLNKTEDAFWLKQWYGAFFSMKVECIAFANGFSQHPVGLRKKQTRVIFGHRWINATSPLAIFSEERLSYELRDEGKKNETLVVFLTNFSRFRRQWEVAQTYPNVLFIFVP